MKKLVPVILSIFFVGCATPSPRSPASTVHSELRVIDAHTHASFSGEVDPLSKIPFTRAEYLREFREAGIVGAVAHTPPENTTPQPELAEYGVIQCFGVAAKVDIRKLEAGLKSGQHKCIKIYLGYYHQYAFDKNYEPVYKLAAKFDVPVIFHTGDTDTHTAKVKYSDPLTIDEVAVDHPQVKFVIAHCGNPWHASAAEVAYKNPNVSIECSGMMIGDLSKRSSAEIERYLIQPISWIFGYVDDPKKMMFGTDWPLVNMKQYLDIYKRAIPPQHWQAVFHDNAAELFKMKR